MARGELDQLHNHALNEGVKMMGERYGLEAADGAIIRPTLGAAMEVFPLPHQHFVQEHLDYHRRRFSIMEKEGAEAVLVVWSLEETARLVVERSRTRWEEEGESPQAVAVVDVGGPIPVMLAFDDPRPLVWEGAAA